MENIMTKNCIILRWDPANPYCSTKQFLEAIMYEDNCTELTVEEHRNIKIGNRFFMIKVGYGTCGVVAAGEIISKPFVDDWDDNNIYYKLEIKCDFMVNPEVLPILECSTLEDNIPDFDWYFSPSGTILQPESADILERLFQKYLHDNAALFARRLKILEKTEEDNDQIYIDEELRTLCRNFTNQTYGDTTIRYPHIRSQMSWFVKN